ncbi:unnamed protein product, partial [Iphiclides podalirius]
MKLCSVLGACLLMAVLLAQSVYLNFIHSSMRFNKSLCVPMHLRYREHALMVTFENKKYYRKREETHRVAVAKQSLFAVCCCQSRTLPNQCPPRN